MDRNPQSTPAEADTAEEPPARTSRVSRATQYHCDYCRKDISTSIRIRCAECADFDLCLDCFSVGVEVFEHKNNHRYRVIEHITEPVFDKTWGADEERLLLESVRLYGLGNWQSISDHVGTKSRFKCQQHYNLIYLNTPSGIPVFNEPLANPKDYKKKKESRLDERRASLLPAAAAISKKRSGVSKHVSKAQDNTLARMVGYLPLRGDFDIEYENDCELYLADMEIYDDDTPAERELKLKVIENYNEILEERSNRKKFILDRGLLFPQGRKRTKEEKELYQNMSCFARFHSKEEHDDFLQGLLNERRIRKRIEQLQQHRLHGITTLAEGQQYEAEKKKREVQESLRREKEKLAYLYSTPRTASSARRRRPTPVDDANSSDNLDPKQQQQQQQQEEEAVAGWDISRMESYSQLSGVEADVCVKLRLRPRQYLAIKESLLTESYRRGFLRPGHDRQLLRVDINKTDRSFDMFLSSGWEINEQLCSRALKRSKQAE